MTYMSRIVDLILWPIEWLAEYFWLLVAIAAGTACVFGFTEDAKRRAGATEPTPAETKAMFSAEEIEKMSVPRRLPVSAPSPVAEKAQELPDGQRRVGLVDVVCVDGLLFYGAKTGIASYTMDWTGTGGLRMVLTVELDLMYGSDGLPLLCSQRD